MHVRSCFSRIAGAYLDEEGQLLQPDFPKKDFFVVGIGKGFEETLELVEEITKEVYNKTKGADIRGYILKKEQEG